MNPQELSERVRLYRERMEEMVRQRDTALRDHLHPVAVKADMKTVTACDEVIRLQIMAEMLESFHRDPEGTASWLEECVYEGTYAPRRGGNED